MNNNVFLQEESILSEITSLYERRGYRRYKPICFEDYSLYLNNRDFLISKDVLTFRGASGRLLALRPDVTLSIVNHANADYSNTQKLYYTEKVYRRSATSDEFREISQTGVEIIGDIDGVCEAEIAILIAETLSTVSKNYVIDISHMGFVEGLISSFGLDAESKARLYGYLRNKNIHDFEILAAEKKLSAEQISSFISAVKIDGNAQNAVRRAEEIALNERMSAAAVQLKGLTDTLTQLGYGDRININFSIVNDADYYNGIIFNGYIDGVPQSVLSGGRYDKLLAKLGKNAGAIGFALYLGELERYFKTDGKTVDYLVVYDDKTQTEALKYCESLIGEGSSVRLSGAIPDGLAYRKFVDMRRS